VVHFMNIASNIVNCMRCMWHTHAFSHVWHWQPVTWRWEYRQLPEYHVYKICVGSVHRIIHLMITVIIRAKFEHMNIWNSFCGTYVTACLITHGKKRTWVQIDHFLCLLHLCYFCTTGRGICCIANTLRGSTFWLVFFTLGHYSF